MLQCHDPASSPSRRSQRMGCPMACSRRLAVFPGGPLPPAAPAAGAAVL